MARSWSLIGLLLLLNFLLPSAVQVVGSEADTKMSRESAGGEVTRNESGANTFISVAGGSSDSSRKSVPTPDLSNLGNEDRRYDDREEADGADKPVQHDKHNDFGGSEAMSRNELRLVQERILKSRALQARSAGTNDTNRDSRYDQGSLFPRGFGVVPLAEGATPIKGQVYPWPAQEIPNCGKRPFLRYCFKNEHSADTLLNVVAEAIARWQPATEYSTMEIKPALKGNGCWHDNFEKVDFRCVCTQETEPDALRIWDGVPDDGNFDKQERTAHSTVGYKFDESSQPRHFMQLGCIHSRTNVDSREHAYCALSAVHEFGHAMGLAHEHQRPDRDSYITFRCENLKGYDKVKQEAAANVHGYFEPSSTLDERMFYICTNRNFAEEFFPMVLQFLKSELDGSNADKGIGSEGDSRIGGSPYDFNSIMHYSSHAYAERYSNGKPWRPSLFRKPPPGEHASVTTSYLFQGGAWKSSRMAISVGDISRLAQMYPVSSEKTNEAKALMRWPPRGVSVGSGLVKVDVYPAPMDPLEAAGVDELQKPDPFFALVET